LASRNASFHDDGFIGALLSPIKCCFFVTLAFAGILLAAWIIDWVFVFQIWPDGIVRLKQILAVDLARGIQLIVQQGGGSGGITTVANGLYQLVFEVTGLHDMGRRFATGAALSIPDTIVRNTYLANAEAIEVAMIGTQLLGVRVATLALIVPLLALLYLVSAVDGMTQRAIRRAAGGRESASLYHRAKHTQVGLLATGLLIGLLWPASIDVRWIGLLLGATLSVFARLQWAYYKKHL